MPQTTFEEVRQVLSRERASTVPRMPQNIFDLSRGIVNSRHKKTFNGREFYNTYKKLKTHGENIIFVSPALVAHFSTVSEVNVDATFKVVLRVPRMLQLLTLHMIHMVSSFPVVYSGMTKKTEAAYVAVFSLVRQLGPDPLPTTVISDLEIALMNGLRTVYSKH